MELPDRYDLEADFAKRVAKLSKKQRAELETLMGEPPELANVPAEAWQRWEQETNDNLLMLLLLIASASAEHHGAEPGDPAVVTGLTGWATDRAAATASGIVQTTQTSLFDFFAKLGQETFERQERERREQQEAETVEHLEPVKQPTFEEEHGEALNEQLDSLFGPKRVEGIAMTETTAAQTAGGEIGVAASVGISPEDTWFTVADDKVCPICTPLHETPRSYWGRFFPDGPPDPHPGCRCYLVYANIGKDAATQ